MPKARQNSHGKTVAPSATKLESFSWVWSVVNLINFSNMFVLILYACGIAVHQQFDILHFLKPFYVQTREGE